MAIKYKINVLQALIAAGYTTYRIRQNKIISEATLSRLRKGEMISLDSLDKICKLLNAQPGDLIKFVDEAE